MRLPESIAIVDLETTGSSALGNRVIEVGILNVATDGSVSAFQTLVNPGRFVPEGILELTGIRREELEAAPSFEDIAEDVRRRLKDVLFIAHNSQFDYSFLRHEFRRAGIDFSAPTFCSVRFSRKLYSEHRRHDLSSIVERHGLDMKNRHRAMDDAVAVLDFMKVAWKDLGEDVFMKAFAEVRRLKPGSCPLPQEDLDRLPESPGVLIFYGTEDQVLSVQAAKSLKEKAFSFFRANEKAGAKALTVSRLETRLTAGEISAAILETELIRSLSPTNNRRPRLKPLILAMRSVDADGYWFPRLEKTDAMPPEIKDVVGIYPTMKKAKEAIQPWQDAHTGCKGREAAVFHNARFIEAFRSPIAKWPFEGPAQFIEYDFLSGRETTLEVLDWRLIGRDGAAGEEPFDWGIYRILKRSLGRSRRGLRVRLLSSRTAEEMASAEDF